ncbi:MAG: hypothetical protein Q7R69_01165 [bacterium]|nr:hypothetical protein [bacterium]
MRSVTITFTEELQDVESGVTPGGAIFLHSMIMAINRFTNTLEVTAPHEIKVTAELIGLKYEDGADEDAFSVIVHRSKVSKMTIEF